MAGWGSTYDMMSFLTCSASPEDGVSFLTCSFGADEEGVRPGEFDAPPLMEEEDDEDFHGGGSCGVGRYGGDRAFPIERVSERGGFEGGGGEIDGVYSIRYDDQDPDVAGDALSDDEAGGGGATRRSGDWSRSASPRPQPLPLDFSRALPPTAAECKDCAKAFKKDRIMGQIAMLLPVASKMDVDMLLSRVTCGLREHGRTCLSDRTDAKKRTILWHAVNCNDVIAVRVFLTAGAGASLSRRREDPKIDPISLALERGQEDIAESLLANLHPVAKVRSRQANGQNRGPGGRSSQITVLDARDDNFADMFWCCTTNGFSSDSAQRQRYKDSAPYDFPPSSPTTPPPTPTKRPTVPGLPVRFKRTPTSK